MAGEAWTREAAREAFSVLAHDIRLAIVLALLDGWAGVHTEARSYSELMDTVGMEDSGKFNYHLERLRGVYVEKVDDGYVPTASATALYRTMLAHRPTDSAPEHLDLEATCPDCETALASRYERSFLTLVCPDCDWPGLTYAFPRHGVVSRPDEDVVRAVEHRTTYHIGLARTGQCPCCTGTTTVDIYHEQLDGRPTLDGAGAGPDGTSADLDGTRVGLSCDSCTWLVNVDVLAPLVFEPRVSAALLELGVHPEVAGDDSLQPALTTHLLSDEPVRLAVEVGADDRTASIVVDGDLNVLSVDCA